MDESNSQNDLVELCDTHSDQPSQNPADEPVFALEADDGQTIRVTQSEYMQLIAPLQLALEEKMDERSGAYIGVDDNSQERLPLCELRGIGCSDKSHTAFLVKGSVQNTVAVISQLVTGTEWLPNCYGTTITVSKDSEAIVFQFVGSAWTIVSGVVRVLPGHYSKVQLLKISLKGFLQR